MSASAVTVAFAVQSAVRDALKVWPALDGVDIATGPRRADVTEGITVARPRATSTYLGAYRAEEGSVSVVADAFVVGTGEDTIDQARARAEELITEVVACFSLAEQTGGDTTLGGLVLSFGSEVTFEEADNYLSNPQERIQGHGYTVAATFTYTARLVTGAAS